MSFKKIYSIVAVISGIIFIVATHKSVSIEKYFGVELPVSARVICHESSFMEVDREAYWLVKVKEPMLLMPPDFVELKKSSEKSSK